MIFDLTGSYGPAFLVAFAFNAMNFTVVSILYARHARLGLGTATA